MQDKKQSEYVLRDVLPPMSIDLVVIGVSTGGPDALTTMVKGLDPNISCPILIVIHIQPGFSEQLAEQLGKRTSLKVLEAKNLDVPKPGEIYICPGGQHMVIAPNKIPAKGGLYEIRLMDTVPVNDCKPSVDVLFSSVAECTKKNVLAVMLTGMGHDGAVGAEDIVNKAGGYVIIQDKLTSIVWGMPKAVIEKNIASEILPLELIGPRISRLVRGCEL